jgi:hypothetical protein
MLLPLPLPLPAPALRHGRLKEVVWRLVHVVAQHDTVGRGVDAAVAVSKLVVLTHDITSEPLGQRHCHKVRALGLVALRHYDAALVALARHLTHLAWHVCADDRRAAIVGPYQG